MFFEDLDWNRAVDTLRLAGERIGREPKSYHCARHTFITMLVGEIRSYFLARMIRGHKSQRSFERYLHIFEMIAREVAQKEQIIDVI